MPVTKRSVVLGGLKNCKSRGLFLYNIQHIGKKFLKIACKITKDFGCIYGSVPVSRLYSMFMTSCMNRCLDWRSDSCSFHSDSEYRRQREMLSLRRSDGHWSQTSFLGNIADTRPFCFRWPTDVHAWTSLSSVTIDGWLTATAISIRRPV